MHSKIIVAGDVHLGADNADVDAFNNFLGDISPDSGPERLVLLGDVWDLVRRDPFGCTWESSETVSRIKRLADEIPVHIIFGNHDAHLRHLDPTFYSVHFHDQYVAESGDHSIRFCHGHAFDRWQSDTLSGYLSGPKDRGEIDPTKGAKDPFVANGRTLVQLGKDRFREVLATIRDNATTGHVPFPRRERRAHAYLETIPEDKLVYGHTHTPYVHPNNRVANPGSWKVTAPIHNTYLGIEDGDITLYRYNRSGKDEVLGSYQGWGHRRDCGRVPSDQ